MHTARLRVELSQSRSEQRDYLKNVELARVLEKRKKIKGELPAMPERAWKSRTSMKREKKENHDSAHSRDLNTVLGSIF